MRSVLRNQRKLLSNTNQDFTMQNAKIWPNPCQNLLNIELNEVNKTIITLRSIDCKTMLSHSIDQYEELSLDGLPNGVYFLEMKNNKNHDVVKIIKTNE